MHSTERFLVESVLEKQTLNRYRRCFILSFLFLLCFYSTFSEKNALASPLWKKRDRIEMVTQCAEWSQFVVDYFIRQSGPLYWEFKVCGC